MPLQETAEAFFSKGDKGMNVFDIIGPVMTGPSSSHTAGAVRIGNAARSIFGKKPDRALIRLYNSFSKTGRGHGTDKALIAGFLGYAPDDGRIADAYDEAKRQGLEPIVEFMGDNPSFHVNTAEILLQNGEGQAQITGKSIGGGRIVITRIDGYETEYTGDYHGLMTIHKDVPGVVSEVTGYLAKMQVNIAFMTLYRTMKGSKVLMMIETDNPIPAEIKDLLMSSPYIEKTAILNQK
jgi:L-serine dehydratase